jgi:integrase
VTLKSGQLSTPVPPRQVDSVPMETGNPVSRSMMGSRMDVLRGIALSLEEGSKTVSTRSVYARAFAAFETWCQSVGVASIPTSPETLALYVAHLRSLDRKVSTVELALVAISQTHLERRYPSPRSDPRIARMLKGYRRIPGTSQQGSHALTEREIRSMVSLLGNDVRDTRDRALLLLGFATGLRRSELVALEMRDVAFDDDGMVVVVRRGKRDQEGLGRRVRVHPRNDELCAIGALKAWTDAAAIRDGHIFRRILKNDRVLTAALSGKAVERVLKSLAKDAGLNSTKISAHSLRSGYATDAARRGVPERVLMSALGHTSLAMTLRYVRDAV